MADWKNLITSHFDSKKERVELSELILCTGAEPSLIESTVAQLGFKVPGEFQDLYSTFNGVGHKQGDYETYWFRPLETLGEFGESCRMWIEEHPDIARRYFPFIDFSNGESAGYMYDDGGSRLDGIYCRYTGGYQYDQEQPWSEFIVKENDTIEGFIADSF